MSVIILLNGHEEAMRPQTATMPWPLLEVAGGTLASYLLLFLAEVLDGQPILLVLSEGNRPVGEQLVAAYPDYAFTLIQLDEPQTDLQALLRCRPHLRPDEPVFLVDGAAIYKADFPAMANGADGAILTHAADADHVGHFALITDEDGAVTAMGPAGGGEQAAGSEQAVGAYWLPWAEQMLEAAEAALATDPAAGWLALWQQILAGGAQLRTVPAQEWEQGLTAPGLLRMNARLLANNFGRSNALERSFGEGFTVLTPVYLADSAEVDGAVLGPYVSIGEDAFVKDAVLANCVISAGAHVEAVVLADSLIGPGARVVGERHELFLGEGETKEL
ncbi:MAG: hypothetical protein H6651_10845 [Ardenticatenales bacterium]|nr:hypothetical protein [Ardenticatenales bacterium]